MVGDRLQTPTSSKPTFDDANEFEVVRFVRDHAPAHCTLKVESFSLLQETHSVETTDHFDSTEFRAGDYKWVLSVYPNGNHNEDGDGYLSLSVRMLDKLSVGSSVSVALFFFIHDQIRDNYLTILDIRQQRFQATKNELGIPKVLALSSLSDPSNGYLVDDCCVLGAEVMVIDVEECAPSKVFALKAASDWKYTWRIEKYSQLRKPLYSPAFTFNGWSWKLLLYPRGMGEEKERSLSLYLKLENGFKLTNGSQLFAKFTFRLKNQLKGSYHKEITQNWFSSDSDWGFNDFVPLSDVFNPATGFVADDVMIVKVEINEMFLVKDVES